MKFRQLVLFCHKCVVVVVSRDLTKPCPFLSKKLVNRVAYSVTLSSCYVSTGTEMYCKFIGYCKMICLIMICSFD